MATQILEPPIEQIEQFEVFETIAPPAPRHTARPYNPSHDEIAALAYEFWQQRGCPDNDAQADWLRAEQELIARKRNSEALYDPD